VVVGSGKGKAGAENINHRSLAEQSETGRRVRKITNEQPAGKGW